MNVDLYVDEIVEKLVARDPKQPEFRQAVEEVLESIKPCLAKHPKYLSVLERVVEPERLIQFRVPWVDDQGVVQTNRGFRVQFSSAIGPYKGGLRFHPSVNQSILKFLGFEQIFKNALTTLPMGGGKGGSDFDPKGKSDREVMAFCQAFMQELSKHIGANTDVPAGDIGVGGREIGYMFGQYKKSRNEFVGVLTGKGLEWGGSLIRPEATGYGAVYFAEEMLKVKGQKIAGKTAVVSGFGNVCQYTIEKLTQLGAKVVTCSDSSGFIYDADGITAEKLDFIMELKNEKRGGICEYARKFPSAVFTPVDKTLDYNPLWHVPADLYFPSATQNEINEKDAKHIAENGAIAVVEGANMPSTPEAIKVYMDAGIAYGLVKAANAGGVACSGLEMSQNSVRCAWTREEVDAKLHSIMVEIHRNAYETSVEYGQPGNYVLGANIAGFTKVAESMLCQGVV